MVPKALLARRAATPHPRPEALCFPTRKETDALGSWMCKALSELFSPEGRHRTQTGEIRLACGPELARMPLGSGKSF